jgi:hypothetical protein
VADCSIGRKVGLFGQMEAPLYARNSIERDKKVKLSYYVQLISVGRWPVRPIEVAANQRKDPCFKFENILKPQFKMMRLFNLLMPRFRNKMA